MARPQAALVLWGPELVCSYNDHYAQLVGPSKHPDILGRKAAVAWAELWPLIGPQLIT
ncbi:MAG: hypothetical protein R3E68_09735 [Burkholderiaceae bacterium]